MSITLTTPTVAQITGPNAVSETDNVGACVSMSIDYILQTATFVLKTGILLGGNLLAGQYGPTVFLVINLSTGAWTASTGQAGTIGAGALTSFNNQLKGDRNLVESFAAGGGALLPGVQVAWV